MIGRTIVSGIFIACVVCFILGAFTTFSPQRSRHKNYVDNKVITLLCSTSTEKVFCHNLLNKTDGEDPRKYVKASIQATLESMNTTLDLPGDIITRMMLNNNTDARLKMSLEDCSEMLESSIEYLLDVASLLNNINDPVKLLKRGEDIQQLVSAVIASQESCFEEVEDPELRIELKNGMLNATKLCHNAMAVVARMKEVYQVMSIVPNITDTHSTQKSRRLLGIEKDGLPTWFSAADRRILAWHEIGKVKPHAVVAQDGSGQYKTISEALAVYPENHRGRYIVYVKAGIYKEVVALGKRHKHVFMYGDGPTKTIVEGDRSIFKDFSIIQTATFSVSGEGFLCKSMGFMNTAGPSQRHAVALRTNADFGIYYDCRIEGYQGTLHIEHFRQFFRNCLISGTVDMIFGQGTAIIQNTEIVVRWYSGQSATVIAHGRVEPNQPTGIVLHNCIITPEKKLYPVRFNIKTFLGRAWKAYSRAIVMESILADFVQPEGWHQWDKDVEYTETSYFGEYNNRGLGARSLNKRVQWDGFVKMHKEDALKFTVENFIQGKSWISGHGVPHMDGLLQ